MQLSSLLIASSCLLFGANAQGNERVTHGITIPENLGARTDFGNRAMAALLESLPQHFDLGTDPRKNDANIGEPTCGSHFHSCSTTYFGDTKYSRSIDSATSAVVWHSDVTPSACQSSKGCDITSAEATADSRSQSQGWEVSLSVTGNIGSNNDKPIVNVGANAGITSKYSKSTTKSTTVTTTKTYKGTCDDNNECFLETGTAFVDITGDCASLPLMVCDSEFNPCDDYDYYSNTCDQWSTFTKKHCAGKGISSNPTQKCSMRFALAQNDGSPLAIQVFQQISLNKFGKRASTSPFGSLPDGSSGAWIPFEK